MMVLVVEDDPSQRALLVRVLEDLGVAVTEAGTIAEAKQVERADLIVSDWSLPDGKASDLKPSVPLVVLSGYDKPPGWSGIWLRKPIHIAELRRMIGEAIAKAGE